MLSMLFHIIVCTVRAGGFLTASVYYIAEHSNYFY